MHAQEKITVLLEILKRIDGFINITNTKASIILAWNGLLLTVLISNFNDIALYHLQTIFLKEYSVWLINIIYFVFLIFSVLSITFSLIGILPNTKSSNTRTSHKPSPKGSKHSRIVQGVNLGYNFLY